MDHEVCEIGLSEFQKGKKKHRSLCAPLGNFFEKKCTFVLLVIVWVVCKGIPK